MLQIRRIIELRCPPPSSPSSRTHSPPRLRGPLTTSFTRRRRFRARPPRPHHDQSGSGPHLHPPLLRLRRRPQATPRYRSGPRLTAHTHRIPHTTTGTPAWGRTTAKTARPPSCPGGHTVKSGACDSRTARVGYCECLRACLMF